MVSKLTDKITGTSSHKLILAHMPLIMVCIEGLGKLAEKFPMLSKQSSDCLREFLTTPSPILSRLSRHYNRQEPKKNLNVPALTVTESSDSIKSIREYADATYDKHSKSLRAFEKLRDCAIDNLCRSIRAQLIDGDQNCLKYNERTVLIYINLPSFHHHCHRSCSHGYLSPGEGQAGLSPSQSRCTD